MEHRWRADNKWLIFWIFCVLLMVYAMVIIGGLTRLSNAGLSMVDWKPLMGAIPPLTDADWLESFRKYQQFPEYQQINKGMTLDAYKYIFYWEYGHRLFGRLIGLVFFIPFAFFLVKGQIKGSLKGKLTLAFILGGGQGLLGWYMVKSGLVSDPRVSQYRLAAHLFLAFFLLCFLYWTLLGLVVKRGFSLPKVSFRGLAVVLFAIISIQILYGALTAGLDAGLMYNTFPDMLGKFAPLGMYSLDPLWKNLFENPVTVQFIHRSLGWLVAFVSLVLLVAGWRSQGSSGQKLIHGVLALAIAGQFILGVATLLGRVPISLASLHQAGAGIVLLIATTNLFLEFRSPRAQLKEL